MNQMRILVVEDEPGVSKALCRVLNSPDGGGYYTEQCDSGEVALKRLRESHFDLLITDLRMPGMNGIELMKQALRVSPSTRSLLMTAYGTPEVRAETEQIAAGYISKPFGLQAFLKAVQATLLTRPPSRCSPILIRKRGCEKSRSGARRCGLTWAHRMFWCSTMPGSF
ncbi:MAG: response regulator [Anaerolineae bacterium]